MGLIGNILGFFKNILTHERVMRCVNRLGSAVLQRYGPQDEYTIQEIDEAIKIVGVSQIHRPMAMAIWVKQSDFQLDNRNQGFEYQQLRSDAARIFFKGNVHFTTKNVLEAAQLPTEELSGGPFAY